MEGMNNAIAEENESTTSQSVAKTKPVSGSQETNKEESQSQKKNSSVKEAADISDDEKKSTVSRTSKNLPDQGNDTQSATKGNNSVASEKKSTIATIQPEGSLVDPKEYDGVERGSKNTSKPSAEESVVYKPEPIPNNKAFSDGISVINPFSNDIAMPISFIMEPHRSTPFGNMFEVPPSVNNAATMSYRSAPYSDRPPTYMSEPAFPRQPYGTMAVPIPSPYYFPNNYSVVDSFSRRLSDPRLAAPTPLSLPAFPFPEAMYPTSLSLPAPSLNSENQSQSTHKKKKKKKKKRRCECLEDDGVYLPHTSIKKAKWRDVWDNLEMSLVKKRKALEKAYKKLASAECHCVGDTVKHSKNRSHKCCQNGDTFPLCCHKCFDTRHTGEYRQGEAPLDGRVCCTGYVPCNMTNEKCYRLLPCDENQAPEENFEKRRPSNATYVSFRSKNDNKGDSNRNDFQDFDQYEEDDVIYRNNSVEFEGTDLPRRSMGASNQKSRPGRAESTGKKSFSNYDFEPNSRFSFSKSDQQRHTQQGNGNDANLPCEDSVTEVNATLLRSIQVSLRSKKRNQCKTKKFNLDVDSAKVLRSLLCRSDSSPGLCTDKETAPGMKCPCANFAASCAAPWYCFPPSSKYAQCCRSSYQGNPQRHKTNACNTNDIFTTPTPFSCANAPDSVQARHLKRLMSHFYHDLVSLPARPAEDEDDGDEGEGQENVCSQHESFSCNTNRSNTVVVNAENLQTCAELHFLKRNSSADREIERYIFEEEILTPLKINNRKKSSGKSLEDELDFLDFVRSERFIEECRQVTNRGSFSKKSSFSSRKSSKRNSASRRSQTDTSVKNSVPCVKNLKDAGIQSSCIEEDPCHLSTTNNVCCQPSDPSNKVSYVPVNSSGVDKCKTSRPPRHRSVEGKVSLCPGEAVVCARNSDTACTSRLVISSKGSCDVQYSQHHMSPHEITCIKDIYQCEPQCKPKKRTCVDRSCQQNKTCGSTCETCPQDSTSCRLCKTGPQDTPSDRTCENCPQDKTCGRTCETCPKNKTCGRTCETCPQDKTCSKTCETCPQDKTCSRTCETCPQDKTCGRTCETCQKASTCGCSVKKDNSLCICRAALCQPCCGKKTPMSCKRRGSHCMCADAGCLSGRKRPSSMSCCCCVNAQCSRCQTACNQSQVKCREQNFQQCESCVKEWECQCCAPLCCLKHRAGQKNCTPTWDQAPCSTNPCANQTKCQEKCNPVRRLSPCATNPCASQTKYQEKYNPVNPVCHLSPCSKNPCSSQTICHEKYNPVNPASRLSPCSTNRCASQKKCQEECNPVCSLFPCSKNPCSSQTKCQEECNPVCSTDTCAVRANPCGVTCLKQILKDNDCIPNFKVESFCNQTDSKVCEPQYRYPGLSKPNPCYDDTQQDCHKDAINVSSKKNTCGKKQSKPCEASNNDCNPCYDPNSQNPNDCSDKPSRDPNSQNPSDCEGKPCLNPYEKRPCERFSQPNTQCQQQKFESSQKRIENTCTDTRRNPIQVKSQSKPCQVSKSVFTPCRDSNRQSPKNWHFKPCRDPNPQSSKDDKVNPCRDSKQQNPSYWQVKQCLDPEETLDERITPRQSRTQCQEKKYINKLYFTCAKPKQVQNHQRNDNPREDIDCLEAENPRSDPKDSFKYSPCNDFKPICCRTPSISPKNDTVHHPRNVFTKNSFKCESKNVKSMNVSCTKGLAQTDFLHIHGQTKKRQIELSRDKDEIESADQSETRDPCRDPPKDSTQKISHPQLDNYNLESPCQSETRDLKQSRGPSKDSTQKICHPVQDNYKINKHITRTLLRKRKSKSSQSKGCQVSNKPIIKREAFNHCRDNEQCTVDHKTREDSSCEDIKCEKSARRICRKKDFIAPPKPSETTPSVSSRKICAVKSQFNSRHSDSDTEEIYPREYSCLLGYWEKLSSQRFSNDEVVKQRSPSPPAVSGKRKITRVPCFGCNTVCTKVASDTKTCFSDKSLSDEPSSKKREKQRSRETDGAAKVGQDTEVKSLSSSARSDEKQRPTKQASCHCRQMPCFECSTVRSKDNIPGKCSRSGRCSPSCGSRGRGRLSPHSCLSYTNRHGKKVSYLKPRPACPKVNSDTIQYQARSPNCQPTIKPTAQTSTQNACATQEARKPEPDPDSSRESSRISSSQSLHSASKKTLQNKNIPGPCVQCNCPKSPSYTDKKECRSQDLSVSLTCPGSNKCSDKSYYPDGSGFFGQKTRFSAYKCLCNNSEIKNARVVVSTTETDGRCQENVEIKTRKSDLFYCNGSQSSSPTSTIILSVSKTLQKSQVEPCCTPQPREESSRIVKLSVAEDDERKCPWAPPADQVCLLNERCAQGDSYRPMNEYIPCVLCPQDLNEDTSNIESDGDYWDDVEYSPNSPSDCMSEGCQSQNCSNPPTSPPQTSPKANARKMGSVSPRVKRSKQPSQSKAMSQKYIRSNKNVSLRAVKKTKSFESIDLSEDVKRKRGRLARPKPTCELGSEMMEPKPVLDKIARYLEKSNSAEFWRYLYKVRNGESISPPENSPDTAGKNEVKKKKKEPCDDDENESPEESSPQQKRHHAEDWEIRKQKYVKKYIGTGINLFSESSQTQVTELETPCFVQGKHADIFINLVRNKHSEVEESDETKILKRKARGKSAERDAASTCSSRPISAHKEPNVLSIFISTDGASYRKRERSKSRSVMNGVQMYISVSEGSLNDPATDACESSTSIASVDLKPVKEKKNVTKKKQLSTPSVSVSSRKQIVHQMPAVSLNMGKAKIKTKAKTLKNPLVPKVKNKGVTSRIQEKPKIKDTILSGPRSRSCGALTGRKSSPIAKKRSSDKSTSELLQRKLNKQKQLLKEMQMTIDHDIARSPCVNYEDWLRLCGQPLDDYHSYAYRSPKFKKHYFTRDTSPQPSLRSAQTDSSKTVELSKRRMVEDLNQIMMQGECAHTPSSHVKTGCRRFKKNGATEEDDSQKTRNHSGYRASNSASSQPGLNSTLTNALFHHEHASRGRVQRKSFLKPSSESQKKNKAENKPSHACDNVCRFKRDKKPAEQVRSKKHPPLPSVSPSPNNRKHITPANLKKRKLHASGTLGKQPSANNSLKLKRYKSDVRDYKTQRAEDSIIYSPYCRKLSLPRYAKSGRSEAKHFQLNSPPPLSGVDRFVGFEDSSDSNVCIRSSRSSPKKTYFTAPKRYLDIKEDASKMFSGSNPRSSNDNTDVRDTSPRVMLAQAMQNRSDSETDMIEALLTEATEVDCLYLSDSDELDHVPFNTINSSATNNDTTHNDMYTMRSELCDPGRFEGEHRVSQATRLDQERGSGNTKADKSRSSGTIQKEIPVGDSCSPEVERPYRTMVRKRNCHVQCTLKPGRLGKPFPYEMEARSKSLPRESTARVEAGTKLPTPDSSSKLGLAANTRGVEQSNTSTDSSKKNPNFEEEIETHQPQTPEMQHATTENACSPRERPIPLTRKKLRASWNHRVVFDLTQEPQPDPEDNKDVSQETGGHSARLESCRSGVASTQESKLSRHECRNAGKRLNLESLSTKCQDTQRNHA